MTSARTCGNKTCFKKTIAVKPETTVKKKKQRFLKNRDSFLALGKQVLNAGISINVPNIVTLNEKREGQKSKRNFCSTRVISVWLENAYARKCRIISKCL